MTENKYGNLLGKFMNGNNSKDYNGMLDKECKKEAENRYGDLLKNATPNMDCLDTMVRLEDDQRRKKGKRSRRRTRDEC